MSVVSSALMPLRTSRDTDGETARVLGKLEAADGALTILRYVANAGNAFRPFVLLSNALLTQSTLPRRSVEVVVLHVAQLIDAPYEIAEHIPMAVAAGVDRATIDAILDGRAESVTVDEPTLVALRLADQLVTRREPADELVRVAIDVLGTAGTMELILIVGWFAGMVRIVVDALGLQEPA